MEVRGAGASPVDWGGIARVAAGALPLPATAPREDRVETLLEHLAAPGFAALMATVERPSSAPPETLLREARTAFERGRPVEALAALARWARANPQAAEVLKSEPTLEPVRAEVETLLRRLTAEARGIAETRLDSAAELVDLAGPRQLSADIDTRLMLAIAARFVEAGRLAECARGGELARLVEECYGSKPTLRAGQALADAGRAAASHARRIGGALRCWCCWLSGWRWG